MANAKPVDGEEHGLVLMIYKLVIYLNYVAIL